MSHTPGPWRVEIDRWNLGHASDPDMIANIYSAADDWNVAEVWGIKHPVAIEDREVADRADANACLIAAAPELLEALQAIMKAFDDGVLCRNTDSDGLSDWALRAAPALSALGRARIAIQKATGGQVALHDGEGAS